MDAALPQLVAHLVRPLVHHPDDVVVSAESEGDRVRLSLRVAPGDVGLVIGRRGSTARALRAVVAAAAARLGRRVILDVVEPDADGE